MDPDKLEKLSKSMEKYHKRFFQYVCIGMVVLITYIIPITSWFTWFAIAAIGAFFCYVIMFTQFSFPFKFGGSGRGIKIGPYGE